MRGDRQSPLCTIIHVSIVCRYAVMQSQWRIQNFIMGEADGRGVGSGEGAVKVKSMSTFYSCWLCPLPRKNEFLRENGGFWCILGLLFTFMQKLVRSMGRPPPALGSATGQSVSQSDVGLRRLQSAWMTRQVIPVYIHDLNILVRYVISLNATRLLCLVLN